MARGVAVKYLERRHVQGGVEAGVVPEFRQRDPLQPLARARMDEAAEVGLQARVDVLRLSIGLRVVR